MTPAQRRTLWLTLAAAGALAVWDVWLLLAPPDDDTISAVLGGQSWALAPLAFVLGHLTTKADWTMPKWTAVAGGVMVTGAAVALDQPLFAVVLGFLGGMTLWPNK